MAEIIINHSIVDETIQEFTKINDTFVIISKIAKDNVITYKFFLEKQECRMAVYFKKNNTVNLVAIGKNEKTTKILIDYISSFGSSAKIETQQVVVNISENESNKMFDYIAQEFPDFISINRTANVLKLNAINGEIITICQYKNKIMIQGKPLVVFSIVTTYLVENCDVTIEEIIDNSTSMKFSTKFINPREELRYLLKDALDYIDQPLTKSITSSLYMLKIFSDSNIKLEDYSGCLTGSFKCLEGYLKQSLIKLEYTFEKKNKKNNFYMFNKNNGKTIIEIGDKNISVKNQMHLINLYRIYSNKRNVYLHGNYIKNETAVISNYKEAKNIFDEIIDAISNSYKDLLGV